MSQTVVSANRLELLQIADAVAREKSIDRQVVITAMEDAIQKAAKSRYGSENEIKAEVDPKTGEISLARLLEVVEDVTLEATQIALADARTRKPRWATSSPSLFPRSISAAWPLRTPNR